MPKIRGIKPDFWTDEDVCELSPFARLLFIGLWNYACDNGHLQDKPKQIKRRILPDDDVNCAELLREIADQGLIVRESGWITVPNLPVHQKPHKRWWSTCEKPGCVKPDEDSPAPNNRRPPVANSGPTEGLGGPTDDVSGSDVMLSGSDGEGKSARKRATQLPSDFRPSDKHTALANSLNVDLRAEWAKFCDYHRAKGSTFKDWSAALNNWIRKAAEFGNVRPLRPEPDEQGRVMLPPLPKGFFEQ